MKRTLILIMTCVLTGCMNPAHSQSSTDLNLLRCRSPLSRPILGHYASKDLLVRQLIRVTARNLLAGSCQNLQIFNQTTDPIYEIRCTQGGCELKEKL